MRNKQLSVVIPAYNEAFNIESILDETKNVLQESGMSYEIIVVDDGSIDLTWDIAKRLGAKVIRFEDNFGKGHALRSGIREAEGDAIVTMDCDGAFDPREIPKLVSALARSDLAIGTRFSRNSNIRPHSLTRTRLFANLFLTLFVRLVIRKPITDALGGFRAYRRATLDKFDITSDGYEIDSEILIKAVKSGLRYTEVPITSRTRYVTRPITLHTTFRIYTSIIRSII